MAFATRPPRFMWPSPRLWLFQDLMLQLGALWLGTCAHCPWNWIVWELPSNTHIKKARQPVLCHQYPPPTHTHSRPSQFLRQLPVSAWAEGERLQKMLSVSPMVSGHRVAQANPTLFPLSACVCLCSESCFCSALTGRSWESLSDLVNVCFILCEVGLVISILQDYCKD